MQPETALRRVPSNENDDERLPGEECVRLRSQIRNVGGRRGGPTSCGRILWVPASDARLGRFAGSEVSWGR
jgi:hypothetical protein